MLGYLMTQYWVDSLLSFAGVCSLKSGAQMLAQYIQPCYLELGTCVTVYFMAVK